MTRRLSVCLGNAAHAVGQLRYDRDGRRERSAFAYDPSWLSNPERFTIDPAQLQLVPGFQFQAPAGPVFHGAIADTEPDGWGKRVILREHARRRSDLKPIERAKHEPLGQLDFLLAVDDESRVGSIRFCDEQGAFCAHAEDGRSRTPPLLELRQLLDVSHAVEAGTETARDLAYLKGRGTSLGGLRPKCSLRDADGSLAIAKFPSIADERNVTSGEVLALTLAKRAGIDVARARIVMADDLPVAVIKRFDRTHEGDRIPYVSAATLLGVSAEDEQEHAYTDIVDALAVHGAQVEKDGEELFRRIALSIHINNVDDHLRNHGFLHVRAGQWKLAPAFDINPFPDRLAELKTWISPNTGPAASIDALLSESPHFRLKPGRAKAIVAEVHAAVKGWRRVASELHMSQRDIESFSDAFKAG